MNHIPPIKNPAHRWFSEARYGLFIHWTPSSAVGRCEQVLMREWLDQKAYAENCRQWNPRSFDARKWADMAVASGMRYSILVTRHHSGYCLWDSKLSDYNSMRQAPMRDFVGEYVEAFRARRLRVGLYYSLGDFRIPAYFEGPRHNPEGWRRYVDFVHGQVGELLSNYGKIDIIWFDGAWPRSAEQWRSEELIQKIRALQPDIMINNRLDAQDPDSAANDQLEMPGESAVLGDFGTPEQRVAADPHRPWESCQVTNHRLWGYARGEHVKTAEMLLDSLCDCASKGGNLLLNVGPDPDGVVDPRVEENLRRIGKWLQVHGEAVYGTDRDGQVSDPITYGYQSRKGNILYLIFRFWPHTESMPIFGLQNTVRKATLLCDGSAVQVDTYEHGLLLKGLPVDKPCDLYPVIRLECGPGPLPLPCAHEALWQGDPLRFVPWARARGEGPNLDGSW
ncbi:MAG: alpha-L-fucosidase [Oceanipulchritudo sp.]